MRGMARPRRTVGEDEARREEVFFKQDALSGVLLVYSVGAMGSTERPARPEEAAGLERAAVWSAEHVEDRLRDHFDGVPNKPRQTFNPLTLAGLLLKVAGTHP